MFSATCSAILPENQGQGHFENCILNLDGSIRHNIPCPLVYGLPTVHWQLLIGSFMFVIFYSRDFPVFIPIYFLSVSEFGSVTEAIETNLNTADKPKKRKKLK